MDDISKLCESLCDPGNEYCEFLNFPQSDFSTLAPLSPNMSLLQGTFQPPQPVTQSHSRPANLFPCGNPNFSPLDHPNFSTPPYVTTPHEFPGLAPGNGPMSHSNGNFVSPIQPRNNPRNVLTELSNISPVLPNNGGSQITLPNPRRNSGVLHASCQRPRIMSLPHSTSFQSESKLAQQLLPLGCVFKGGWVRICESAHEGEDVTVIIRRCLDADKVKSKKPQELSTILDSAHLSYDQKAKVQEFRRKMMRQKNRQARSNGATHVQPSP